jgi:hypothetical protein
MRGSARSDTRLPGEAAPSLSKSFGWSVISFDASQAPDASLTEVLIIAESSPYTVRNFFQVTPGCGGGSGKFGGGFHISSIYNAARLLPNETDVIIRESEKENKD